MPPARTPLAIYVAVGVVALGLLGLFVFGFVRGFRRGIKQHALQEAAAAAGWTGKTPFTCGGDQAVTIDNVTASFPSTTVAITASGSCRLTLTNVNAKGRMALFAGGNSVVDVTGGSLEGTDFSITAGGAAKVILHDVKLTGSTQHAGSATIEGIQ